MDDADLDRPGLDHPHPAVGNLAFLADQYFSHLLRVLFYVLAPYDGALVSSAPYRRPSSSGTSKSSQPGTSATSENGLPNGRVASTPMAGAVSIGRGRVGSSIDGSEGPAGMSPTMMTSLCGCTRNAIAHSTSADECTSMSGSTTVTHFGRILLDIAERMTCRASPAKRCVIEITT